jgi:hypothetical protein
MPVDGLGVGVGEHAKLAMTNNQAVAIRASEAEPFRASGNVLP